MKRTIFLLLIVILSGCGGGRKDEVNQHELYGKKRVDCTSTKRTDQAANITQCSQIRPDDKELKNLNNNSDPYMDKPKKSGQFVDPQPQLSK